MCLCLWMIAHMFGAEGSALLSARASLVCLLVHRSSACSCIARLPFVCRYSARDMGARASDRLSDRASLVRLIVRLIVRRSSVTDLSVRPYLLVHRLCIARLPVPLPLVCLLCRCPVVGLPLICHACIARLSPRLSAGLPLSCRWSSRSSVCSSGAGLSLVRRWSVCSSVSAPSLIRRCPVSSCRGR